MASDYDDQPNYRQGRPLPDPHAVGRAALAEMRVTLARCRTNPLLNFGVTGKRLHEPEPSPYERTALSNVTVGDQVWVDAASGWMSVALFEIDPPAGSVGIVWASGDPEAEPERFPADTQVHVIRHD